MIFLVNFNLIEQYYFFYLIQESEGLGLNH